MICKLFCKRWLLQLISCLKLPSLKCVCVYCLYSSIIIISHTRSFLSHFTFIIRYLLCLLKTFHNWIKVHRKVKNCLIFLCKYLICVQCKEQYFNYAYFIHWLFINGYSVIDYFHNYLSFSFHFFCQLFVT